MSSIRIKTKYYTEDGHGASVEHTLYAVHNNTVDMITVFDEDGDPIMWIPDTVDNNILDAINRLCKGYRDENDRLKKGIESMTSEDRGLCGI